MLRPSCGTFTYMARSLYALRKIAALRARSIFGIIVINIIDATTPIIPIVINTSANEKAGFVFAAAKK